MNTDDRIEQLENRIQKIEDNLKFLNDLLTHLHSQFQSFKKDTER